MAAGTSTQSVTQTTARLNQACFAAVAKRRSRAIGQFGRKRDVVKVFAAFRAMAVLLPIAWAVAGPRPPQDRDHAALVDPIGSGGYADHAALGCDVP